MSIHSKESAKKKLKRRDRYLSHKRKKTLEDLNNFDTQSMAKSSYEKQPTANPYSILLPYRRKYHSLIPEEMQVLVFVSHSI